MIFQWSILVVVCGGLLFFVGWFIYELLLFIFVKDTKAMYVPSFDKHIRLMKLLNLIPGKKLVDLGCGDGKAMRFFAREFNLQCDGYEFQLFPYYYGKLCNRLLGYSELIIYKKNFFLADLKKYDYIYLYLLPNQMADIESRIFTHMTDNAIIISNSFQFALHKPFDVIKDKKGKPSIFLYRKN